MYNVCLLRTIQKGRFVMLSTLIGNFGEAVGALLFVIGFANLLLQKNLI